MNTNAKATYEFQWWNRATEKQLKALLQNLPVWQGLDEYADEQGLTEAFYPYERLEGTLEQTLHQLQGWVQTARRYCKRLVREYDAEFANSLFSVHCAPNWLELEAVLEYYPPSESFEEEEREAEWEDSEPLPRYAPFGCVVAKVGTDQFCSYMTTEEGFQVELDHNSGDLPYGLFEFSEWNSKVEGLLQTFLQHLKVVRSIDHLVEYSGFRSDDPTYLTVEGAPKDVVEPIRSWLLSSIKYVQEEIADPESFVFRHICPVRADASCLSLSVDEESYASKEVIRNGVVECQVYRVGKHRFQVVFDPESTAQEWVEKMRWFRSASPEELREAGWIEVGSSVGWFETVGRSGATYYMADSDEGSAPADSEED